MKFYTITLKWDKNAFFISFYAINGIFLIIVFFLLIFFILSIHFFFHINYISFFMIEK